MLLMPMMMIMGIVVITMTMIMRPMVMMAAMRMVIMRIRTMVMMTGMLMLMTRGVSCCSDSLDNGSKCQLGPRSQLTPYQLFGQHQRNTTVYFSGGVLSVPRVGEPPTSVTKTTTMGNLT